MVNNSYFPHFNRLSPTFSGTLVALKSYWNGQKGKTIGEFDKSGVHARTHACTHAQSQS